MKKFLCLSLLLFFVSVMPFGFSFAAEEVASPGDGSAQLQALIDKLENDDERKALVDDLKLLLQQQDQANDADTPLDEPLTETLGVRSGFEKIVGQYDQFLEENNLSSSLVHQSIGSGVVLMIAAGFFFGVRRLSRKILKSVDRLSQKIGLKLSRFGLYATALQFVLKTLIVGLTLYTLGKIWSIDVVVSLFEGTQMRAFIGTAFTVLFVAFFAAIVWEIIGVTLAYVLKQADSQNQTRLKTLLPIVRNIVMIVVGLLFGLVLLSEVGINVTPLLAGAGVIGVAVGFGAQSMVKDFLTGFTIVFEDLVRVGDVVTVAGNTGLVEQITLRKIQLRDIAGIVYTIPFSDITTIQNMTKDYSYYVMNIGVTYNVDTDRVVDVLHQVDEDLRSDPNFSSQILDPLEILGVDQFADSAVIIKARIKTLPIRQWAVGREFNRRMKHAFDKAGIEIPFPQRTVTVVSQQGSEESPSLEKISQLID